MKLDFELDPQIIHHIIYSQAGSIGKALIELIMNSVDAKASRVDLSMTKVGFTCADDGAGFQSREDVLRYFGRFGTPHQEGDATFGRFRLGRGQIMAHASTSWFSNAWQMDVDTRVMGYSYELTDLVPTKTGCAIEGLWYEELTEEELQSCIQEVRDLVRYTPLTVILNARTITKDPSKEQWDHEDENAYFRVREEGAVSIYNQGVLVRHDASGAWGAGGLIVTKKAIGLNVSRTEILRKTCLVWKQIGKRFSGIVEVMNANLGDHRKTEARREKCAKAMLSGDAKIWKYFENEEVITVLPGKRHMTLWKALTLVCECHQTATIVERSGDVAKGEGIAKQGIALVIHGSTLERFGCYSPFDFAEALERVFENLRATPPERGKGSYLPERATKYLKIPTFVAFEVLKRRFTDRTRLVLETEALDKETRRAWTALRWCLRQYAGACLGDALMRGGRLAWRARHQFNILAGESNMASAWTNGSTYIAINVEEIKRLRTDPLTAASRIFALVEHEVAHEGDSLDCGHDEAFFQRYHDISIRMAAEKQRFIHIWLMKYTQSMEKEGKKATGDAWAERMLVDRVGNGRKKRGLGAAIEDLVAHPLVLSPPVPENRALVQGLNASLVTAGLASTEPDWNAVREEARLAQQAAHTEWQATSVLEAELHRMHDAHTQLVSDEVARIALELSVDPSQLGGYALEALWKLTGQALKSEWEAIREYEQETHSEYEMAHEMSAERPPEVAEAVPEELRPHARNDETMWMLRRNAAAAGFFSEAEYLRWRGLQEA